MKEEAPNHLMKLIPKSKQSIRTKNNIIPSYNFRAYCFKFSFSSLSYQVTITEHIVSSVFFPLYRKLLVQCRWQHKKFRTDFNIQK